MSVNYLQITFLKCESFDLKRIGMQSFYNSLVLNTKF